MANHCVVKTLDPMTYADVSALIGGLNARVFAGLLAVERHVARGPDWCWPPGWFLEVPRDGGGDPWMGRCCWLESPHHFEIRHGGGTEFAWWVDHAVTNEVACRSRGLIVDDGIPDRPSLGVVGAFDDPAAYLEGSVASPRPDYRRFLLLDRLATFPPPLRARAEAGLRLG